MGVDRRDRLGEPSGIMGRCSNPMPRAALLALAVAAVILPAALAQDRATDLPLITGLRCACGQPIEPTPLQSAQRADGRFPVAGDPCAELRFTAVVCLAIVGDGSTRASGSYAHQLGHAMDWLEQRIDERGRIGFEARPGWLPVSVIASCAVAEDACTTVEFDASRKLAAIVSAHARELAHRREIDVEMLWWADWLCRAARSWAERRVDLERECRALGAPLPEAVRIDHDALRSAIDERLAELPRPEGVWEPSLYDELIGETRDLPPVARASELLNDDPRACFYLIHQAWRRGGETWEEYSRVLGRPIAQRIPSRSSEVAFDEGAAWDVLSTEFYYRYSKLRSW